MGNSPAWRTKVDTLDLKTTLRSCAEMIGKKGGEVQKIFEGFVENMALALE